MSKTRHRRRSQKKIISYTNEHSEVKFVFRDGFPSIAAGFGNIKRKMPALLKMAKKGLNSFVITDLDQAICPPSLIREWIGEPKAGVLSVPSELLFRVAVREIEAWIMADREGISRFLNIPIANFTREPDNLPDPKRTLLTIISNKGRKRWQKEMLPQYPTATIGPLYNEKLCEFIKDHWNPSRARVVSPSLDKALYAFL